MIEQNSNTIKHFQLQPDRNEAASERRQRRAVRGLYLQGEEQGWRG